ncbi:MAG TPA: hypothetical protein VG389_03585, partial [Myxococcota bacterium]|nr:hypothetical protein [Myxococcota bacterium]
MKHARARADARARRVGGAGQRGGRARALAPALAAAWLAAAGCVTNEPAPPVTLGSFAVAVAAGTPTGTPGAPLPLDT